MLKQQYAFGFIHIPKNAGTSIKNSVVFANKNMKYYAHRTDIDELPNNKTYFIIIRDPLYRFCSAVDYHIKHQLSHKKNSFVSQLLAIDKNFIHPNDWAEALGDPNHRFHNLLIKTISNPNHKFGKKFPGYNYIFLAQSTWIRQDFKVLIFENLIEEIELFLKIHNLICEPIPHLNNNNKKYDISKFSNTALQYLKQQYSSDIVHYNSYKQLCAIERIK